MRSIRRLTDAEREQRRELLVGLLPYGRFGQSQVRVSV